MRHNLWNGRYVWGFFIGFHTFWWNLVYKPSLYLDVFGHDGNGGRMLKIITDLTDEEIARNKYIRRIRWHARGVREEGYGHEKISNQELSDRGIKIEEEPYVEYLKRPPHDKYL